MTQTQIRLCMCTYRQFCMIMGGVLYWSAFFSFPRMIKKFKERVHLSWEKLVTFLQVEIWPFEDFDQEVGKMLLGMAIKQPFVNQFD